MGSHSARTVTAYRTTALDADDSDSADLPQVAQGLFILTAGNIRIRDGSGRDTGTFAIPTGLFPIQVRRIYASPAAVGFVLYDKDPS